MSVSATRKKLMSVSATDILDAVDRAKEFVGYADIRQKYFAAWSSVFAPLHKDDAEIEQELSNNFRQFHLKKHQDKQFMYVTLLDPRHEANHYSAVLIDKKSRQALLIDPAGPTGCSTRVYLEYAKIDFVRKLVQYHGYVWNEIQDQCQTSLIDTFCQTWSLFLALKKLEGSDFKLPEDEEARIGQILSELQMFIQREHKEWIKTLTIDNKLSLKQARFYDRIFLQLDANTYIRAWHDEQNPCDDIEMLTNQELRRLCKQNGVNRGLSRLKKQELIDLLQS